MMIRRALLLLLLAVHLVGCWSRVEVNDLAIVSMMGVDKTEDGETEIWLQVLVPARVGRGQEQEKGGRSFVTLRASGETIMDAAKHLQTEMPRRIFWAHARVILIGENLAEEGVQTVLDFLTRHRELRLTDYVLVAKGNLGEIMSVKTDLEPLPVESIREITRSRIGPEVTLGDFAKHLAAKGASPIAGVVEISLPPPDAPEGQMAALKLSGTAIFRGDRLVGYMDEHLTRGLLWLRDNTHLGAISVEVPKAPGRINLEWTHTAVERSAWLDRGRVIIWVNATVEGEVAEQQAKLDLADPKAIDLIERELRKEIKARIEAALEKLRELKSDAAGLGEIIHRQMPAVWKRLESDWEEEGLEEAKVVIKVDAQIRRTGMSSKPRGVRDQELFKEGK